MFRALLACSWAPLLGCGAGDRAVQSARQRMQEVGPTWQVSSDELGPCPEPQCGQEETTHTRVVFCVDSGEVVDDDACPEDKPPSSLTCPATAACIEYSWQADDFGPCNTACDTPAEELSRSVRCVGDDGSEGDSSSCTGAKPADTLRCEPSAPCTGPYAWDIIESACPAACGTAASTVERNVVCEDSDGLVAPATSCADPKPSTEQDCPATPACVVYDWSAPDFDPCPTECGLAASTLTREVMCRGSDDSVGGDANCTVDSRPASTMECDATANCEWHYDEFGACPSDCGLAASVLERVVECTDPADTTKVVENARCNYEDKPAEGHPCEATARCVVYEWDVPNFEDCDTSCGLPLATIHRTVTCRGDDGSIGPSPNSCGVPKPAEAHTCQATPNCTTAELYEYLQNNPDCQVGQLIFNYDIETLTAGSSSRIEFEGRFKAEVARFVGVAVARVQVLQTKAGSMIVVFTIKEPGSQQGESEANGTVSSAEAMHKLSRAINGHAGESSHMLFNETEFTILSTVRLESGLRTDVTCELAMSPGADDLDCDLTDEWSTLQDEFEDFSAAPTQYVSDSSHLKFVGVAGVLALAILALLFCLCRRCFCQSQQQYEQMGEDDSQGSTVTKPAPYLDATATTRRSNGAVLDLEGGDGSGRGTESGLSSSPSVDDTSSDFDDAGEDQERNAMLSASQMMQGEGSFREAVFRGSS